MNFKNKIKKNSIKSNFEKNHNFNRPATRDMKLG